MQLGEPFGYPCDFADVNGHTKEEVQSYEDGYACPDMNFCYDEDDVIFFLW